MAAYLQVPKCRCHIS